jgi:hypothetical protein
MGSQWHERRKSAAFQQSQRKSRGAGFENMPTLFFLEKVEEEGKRATRIGIEPVNGQTYIFKGFARALSLTRTLVCY